MIEAASAMTFDFGAANLEASAPAGGQVSVFDMARFEDIHSAQDVSSTEAVSQVTAQSGGFRAALQALETLNGTSDIMGKEALAFAANGKELTPGEMLQVTMHAHQFLFHSELTANVANRTSDGIQQLFRQQS